MNRAKNKSEFGIVSGLAFVILGGLMCTMLFSGEARTYGQFVAAAIGTMVGTSDWWKSKPTQLHFIVISVLLIITVIVALRDQLISLLKNIFYEKH